jgi:hypothetical protein
VNVKRGPRDGDGVPAPLPGAPPTHATVHRTPDDHAMRLQKLKHMVEADAYRVDPQAVAVALLMRVDPRRDLFTGLLSRPGGRSPADPAGPSGPAG